MYGSAEPDAPRPAGKEPTLPPHDAPTRSLTDFVPAAERSALPPNDLEAALQLLVDRARYITGATGAALALLQSSEMVCRASAGSCAPAVGARLQVRSGLTGESISRRQLLRCDNAESDPRVNLDTCRELGIASIVVLPLLARTGEVNGLFELFSDHPYAFEERDLIALERMAALTRTALDLSEKREVIPAPRAAEVQPAPPPMEQSASPAAVPEPPAETKIEVPAATNLQAAPAAANPEATPSPAIVPEPPIAPTEAAPPAEVAAVPESANPLVPNAEVATVPSAEPPAEAAPSPQPVPDAMLRVQKCSSCGFPISDGRTLCLDCESKQPRAAGTPAEILPAEFVPAFLSSQKPPSHSWLADHVNLLAILVLILSIVVAVVVFR